MSKADEDMVFAIGNLDDGTKVLVLGLTASGIEKMAEKKTLVFTVPHGVRNISQGIVFAEATQADLRQRFVETGIPISNFPS